MEENGIRAREEVWKDALGLGHCSIPISTRDEEMDRAKALISQLGISTNAPIVFERVTHHGTVIYGHDLRAGTE